MLDSRSVFRTGLFGTVLLASALGLFGGPALACSIPVFRYALERWPPDAYHAVLFHRGPLSESDQALVKQLDGSDSKIVRFANIAVHDVDLSGEVSQEVQKLWKAQKANQTPWLVIRYPVWSGIPIDLWSGPLSAAPIKQLLDSPTRQQIVKKIAAGESAVWVFLESGHKDQDQAAWKTLQQVLKKMERVLKLPEQDPFGPPMAGDPFGPEPVELKLSFATLRLSRTDPAEKMFVEMLLGTEEDLKELDQPMAFPVFGRGRALYALVGKGINEDNIGEACAFLVGECSCQVKAMNPGTDLLIAADWDGLITGQVVTDEPLPELTGLSGFAEPAEQPAGGAEAAANPAGAARPADAGQPGPDAAVASTDGTAAAGTPAAGHAAAQTPPANESGQATAAGPSAKPAVQPLPTVPVATEAGRRRAGQMTAGHSGDQTASGSTASHGPLLWTSVLTLAAGVVIVVVGSVLVLLRRG